jgi:FtsX-like permease family protein
VLSGSGAERMREIGVRSALGASWENIYGLVIGQGMTLAGIGAILGVGGAVFASRALVTLLFGVSALDVETYAGVVILLPEIARQLDLLAIAQAAWRANVATARIEHSDRGVGGNGTRITRPLRVTDRQRYNAFRSTSNLPDYSGLRSTPSSQGMEPPAIAGRFKPMSSCLAQGNQRVHFRRAPRWEVAG